MFLYANGILLSIYYFQFVVQEDYMETLFMHECDYVPKQ